MQTDWLKGYLGDKEEFAKDLLKNKWFLEQLNRVTQNKLDELNKPSTKSEYDSLSWPYWAAHKEGIKEALNYILLLTKEERKT